MKKLLILFCAVALASVLGTGCEKDSTQDDALFYYTRSGTKERVTVMNTKYYLVFPTASTSTVVETLTQNGANVDVSQIFDYTRAQYAIIGQGVPEFANCSELIVETTQPLTLDMLPDLIYLAPFYRLPDGAEMGITNTLEVRPTSDQDLEKLQTLAQKYNVFILGQNQFDQSIYTLACTKESQGNALEIANRLHGVDGFDYATPEVMLEVIPCF